MQRLLIAGVFASAHTIILVGCGGAAVVETPDPTACAGRERWVRLEELPREYPYGPGLFPVWTGSRLLWPPYQFKGVEHDGYAYDVVAKELRRMPAPSLLQGRSDMLIAWAGERLVVWGGRDQYGSLHDDGAAFDPTTGDWHAVAGQPDVVPAQDQPYFTPRVVGTGTKMMLWWGPDGGWLPAQPQHGGAILDVGSGSWSAFTSSGAPATRRYHSLVWTGTQLVLWGGLGNELLDDGGRYDVAGDTWRPTSTQGAPSPRSEHAAVWTGSHMFVWGGSGEDADGGLYDPVADTWESVTTSGAPAARFRHYAVWTGDRVVVFGGHSSVGHSVVGGVYDPLTDRWVPSSAQGLPVIADPIHESLTAHTGAWDGCRVLVPLAHCGWTGDPADVTCSYELWAYEPPSRD